MNNLRQRVIMLVEDDPEDRFLIERALQKIASQHRLLSVENGEQLLHYLRGKDAYADRDEFPLPSLILLDLNMPKMDGRSVLRELRKDKALESVPVVVLTTSESEEDIIECYKLGANSYVCKPSEFDRLMSHLQALISYWFKTVELPEAGAA